MKYAADRPYTDPEKAARRILEIANSNEAIQDGRIHVEKINEPFLFRDGGRPTEYAAGTKLAVERGWLVMHEPGTFVRWRRVVRVTTCYRCEDSGWVCQEDRQRRRPTARSFMFKPQR
jgi:hypothetical protein